MNGILESPGFTASVAIDMYYRQIARCNGIPFHIISIKTQKNPKKSALEKFQILGYKYKVISYFQKAICPTLLLPAAGQDPDQSPEM